MALALGACVTAGESIRLASIHQFESTEIIAGEEFKVFGDGFVPGEVQIVLDGLWLTPGRHARRMSIAFAGNAITEKEISTLLPLDVFRQLGATHALFQGDVLARFRASDRVKPDFIEAVRSRVILDVLGNEPDGGRDLSALEKKTDRFLALVGVAGQSDPEGGFLLSRVEEGGPAERAGLEPGDLVVVARGMRVTSEIDLLPPPMSSELAIVVARKDSSGGERLRKVSLRIPNQVDDGTNPIWVVAGAAAGSLVLLQGEVLALLLLPLRRLRELIAAIVRRLAPGRESVVPVSEDEDAARVPGSRWMQSMLSLPVVIATASACAGSMLTLAGSMHVVVVYAALVLLSWLTGFKASRGSADTFLMRVRRFAACLLVPAPVAVMFIWRGLYSLRPTLQAAAAGQGLEPWTWHGLGDPFALVIALMGLQAILLGERRDITLARYLAHQAYAVAMCAVIAYVMMGGMGQAPGLAETGTPQAVGLSLMLYVAKVLGLYLVVQAWSRDRQGRRTSDISIMLLRPLILVGAMVGSVMLGPSMTAVLPSLPYITASTGGAVMLVLAASGRGATGTMAIRLRPW